MFIDGLELTKQRARENLEAVKSDVSSTFNTLLDQLKHRERVLIQQAENVLKEQMRMIEMEEQRFYDNLKCLEKLCKSDLDPSECWWGSRLFSNLISRTLSSTWAMHISRLATALRPTWVKKTRFTPSKRSCRTSTSAQTISTTGMWAM